MSGRVWIAIACLVLGVPVAAWGLANGSLLIGLLGLAFVLVFIFLVVEAMNQAAKPKHEIPKSANPAWSMKDQPPRTLDRQRGDGGSL
jgi:Na+-transporting methylmalonyl-CoA/oxaloacetate decarboxylase gamma subunit